VKSDLGGWATASDRPEDVGSRTEIRIQQPGNRMTMMSKMVILMILTSLSTMGRASDCVGTEYASDKSPAIVAKALAGDANYQTVDELQEARKLSDKIILKQTPLAHVPPEIARIQKGFVKHYVGAFINDGTVNWRGVDLDRGLAIVVHRNMYDKRAQMQRSFGDPAFKSWDNQSFARKWVGEGRTETEVILRRPLTVDEVQAFTCMANELWKSDGKQQSMLPTDTMMDESTLLDRTSDGNAAVLYEKPVHPAGPFESMLSEIWRAMPEFENAGMLKKFSAESRRESQSCNSNSDCLGALMCIDATCRSQ
jgi:hypothetical protein